MDLIHPDCHMISQDEFNNDHSRMTNLVSAFKDDVWVDARQGSGDKFHWDNDVPENGRFATVQACPYSI